MFTICLFRWSTKNAVGFEWSTCLELAVGLAYWSVVPELSNSLMYARTSLTIAVPLIVSAAAVLMAGERASKRVRAPEA